MIVEELAKISMPEDISIKLGFRIDLDPEHRQPLVEQGLWWIRPLFNTRVGRAVGVALLPDVPMEHAPIVMYEDGVAVTIASCARLALPLLVYRMSLAGLPKNWEKIRKADAQMLEVLEHIEQALGGESGVSALQAVAERTELVDRDDKYGKNRDERRAAQAEILAALDSSEEHQSFRRWMDRFVRERSVPTQPETDVGTWRRQADLALFLAAQFHIADMELWRSAWNLLSGPANLDTCNVGVPIHLPEPVSIASTGSLSEAARAITEDADTMPASMREHPLWLPSMLMGQEGDAYTGLEHVQAAALLDASGRPQESWYALMSACFWSYCRQGAGFRGAAQAARYLAEREGWEHIGEHLAALSIELSPDTLK